VFIPTRNRRERAGECIESFRGTTKGDVDLVLVVDDDDDSYDGIDVPVITVPHGNLVTAINDAAMPLAREYRALMLAADDVLFRTPGWDEHMMESLEVLGGSGFVYPDDKRRYDVPEHVLITSDVISLLGWFAEPAFGHFFIDNVWAELGKRSGLIRYCHKAVVEHRHYSIVPEVPRDAVYLDAEQSCGEPDLAAFHEWQAQRMSGQVAQLRRRFNRDVQWVLSKI
jgi:glycosyltransferase involved in cell wall biosynthesis